MSFKLQLRVDNLHNIHQYDLVARLLATYHPQFGDIHTRLLVEREISDRIGKGKWTEDDKDTNELLHRLDTLIKKNIVSEMSRLIPIMSNPVLPETQNVREIVTSPVQTVTV